MKDREPFVLIISDLRDSQIYFVMLELEKLGVPFGLFNAADFPTKTSVSQKVGRGVEDCVFAVEDGTSQSRHVHSSGVSAVWYRKPSLPRLHINIAKHEREFAFNEARAGLRAMYDALGHAYWISPLDNIRSASNKVGQLRRAQSLGMIIPSTILTNDEAQAREFIAAARGRVVYKSIGDHAILEREGSWDAGVVVAELYTTLIDQNIMEQELSRLSACPALLQEYVDKAVELRVTVVGEFTFVAELDSQASPMTAVDWRKGDVFEIPHRVHELPQAVHRQCIALTKSYGLNFGAIDLIRRSDGVYVFLEINANGQYGWVEGLTGLKISEAIAKQLANAGLPSDI
jgi:glutathione synthase/RimK-type ligase-like ATP-grasp enzyme